MVSFPFVGVFVGVFVGMGGEKGLTIRSFVYRGGRVTAAQQRGLAEGLPRFGLPLDQPVDWDGVFGRAGQRAVEIGCGMGDALVEMALARPDWDFIGIEVYPPGLGHLLHRVLVEGIANIRVMQGDATVALREAMPAASLDQVMLFFPDPWPKKKHQKRRIVQSDFVRAVAAALKPGGEFALATDWEDYAHHMLTVLEPAPPFTNAHGPGQFAPDPWPRPETKFERRGLRLGHGVWDLRYTRNEMPLSPEVRPASQENPPQ